MTQSMDLTHNSLVFAYIHVCMCVHTCLFAINPVTYVDFCTTKAVKLWNSFIIGISHAIHL